MARMAAYWSLAVLLFYGCYSLYYALLEFFPARLEAALFGITIPIIGLALNPALVISALALGSGLFLIYRWQNQAKVADGPVNVRLPMPALPGNALNGTSTFEARARS